MTAPVCRKRDLGKRKGAGGTNHRLVHSVLPKHSFPVYLAYAAFEWQISL